jgi:flavin-dependent thymidylate synthase
MASDNLRCPTCGSRQQSQHPAVSGGGEVTKICQDPWHNPELAGEANFNYKVSDLDFNGDEALFGGITPEMAERITVLRDASITLSGTFDQADEIPVKVRDRPDPAARVQRWADVAMWQAPHDPLADAGLPVSPTVTLLMMTPMPVQTMAAAAALYRGEIIRDVRSIPMEESLRWLRQTQLSRASQSQLEFVDLHFLIEGVTRAFTHQLVRQRVGATYVQESMRFAVKDNARFEIALPPFFDNLADDHPLRRIWDRAVAQNSWSYNAMVDGGLPAEDARGLLPTNITTRIHYKTTLRGLVEHAGLRLCSQAQHEWKSVWDGFITGILGYGPEEDLWQQTAIASLFRPICYNTGKCEFMGENDRFCPIRERVQAHHAQGDGPDKWSDIHPLEALRYGAARVSPDVAGNV